MEIEKYMTKTVHAKAITKIESGKKSRAAGQRFEKRVREDLEKQGWVVDKWTNNVELTDAEWHGKLPNWFGKLVPAKPKFVFNPVMKRRVMMGNSSGFPDFICYLYTGLEEINHDRKYNIIGVESKMNGVLDKQERAKCKWLIENRIFNKIYIAQKGQKRGEIIYKEFKSV